MKTTGMKTTIYAEKNLNTIYMKSSYFLISLFSDDILKALVFRNNSTPLRIYLQYKIIFLLLAN